MCNCDVYVIFNSANISLHFSNVPTFFREEFAQIAISENGFMHGTTNDILCVLVDLVHLQMLERLICAWCYFLLS